MKSLLYICCLFVGFSLGAQAQNSNLKTQDSLLLSSYKQKIAQYVNPLPDSALYYARNYKSVAKDLDYDIGIADGDYLLGACYKRIEKIDSAIFHFQKSRELSQNIQYDLGKGRALNNLSRTYYVIGKMDSSIVSAKEAIESVIPIENPSAKLILADSYIALSTAYARKNMMKEAIEPLLLADSLHRKSPLRPDIIAAAYQALGSIYLDLEEYDSAVTQFEKANSEFSKLPETVVPFYLNTTNVFMGKAFLENDQLIKADSLLRQSYSYFTKAEDFRLVAEIATYLGQLALKKNDPIQANSFYEESYRLHKASERPYEAGLAAIELANLSLSKNQPDKALQFLNDAESLNAEAQNSRLRQDILFSKAEVYSLKGNYKLAFNLSRRAKKLQDSLQNVQNAAQIKEIEALYETESRDREIALLTSQNELAAQQKKNQRNLFAAGLGVTTLAGLFFFFQYRNRQKTTRKLKELDRAKSTFFANISHEFRTPLTLIKGPLEDQLERQQQQDASRKNLLNAHRSAERLERLVEQLLALSKLESGTFSLHVQPDSLYRFLSVQVEAFHFLAAEQNITITTDFNLKEEELHWFDRDALEKICVNLIGNACKYTPEKHSVLVEAAVEKGFLQLAVQNTGVHFNEHQQAKVFDRFYQVEQHGSGSGIGLALTKELVELHKGTIHVVSEANEITFRVALPVTQSYFSEKEQLHEQWHLSDDTEIIQPEIVPEVEELLLEDAPVLLIVEDARDVREYIATIFESSYKVITAEQGEEGFSIAKEVVPDIIISDVMMPISDGFEFTHKCKSHQLTSHIPILLLTAKGKTADQIEGLEKGADAYVKKPFSPKLLKARVENLLENRRKLHERFSQELILVPKEIKVSSQEEKFLKRLQEVLDNHVTDPDFTATKFSEQMGMSRMQLHRKLKGIIGVSSTELLKDQRLKLAKNLLKDNKASISEIGYMVGFNDPSYFSKCFKQAFGTAPSAYVEASE
ncbi:hybrid sensor histidine kinase/response regulator transcription factor [Luteirhabdus pelagi]|uniref:hybrid sensor histidine kinase/response regulator transcription factor n=1 Tax=Luteirhabdus pelagi TaxID=2792783 RepID=UPI001939FE47|nr:response regulator [Luteirhabdus pelagi]